MRAGWQGNRRLCRRSARARAKNPGPRRAGYGAPLSPAVRRHAGGAGVPATPFRPERMPTNRGGPPPRAEGRATCGPAGGGERHDRAVAALSRGRRGGPQGRPEGPLRIALRATTRDRCDARTGAPCWVGSRGKAEGAAFARRRIVGTAIADGGRVPPQPGLAEASEAAGACSVKGETPARAPPNARCGRVSHQANLRRLVGRLAGRFLVSSLSFCHSSASLFGSYPVKASPVSVWYQSISYQV